MRVLPMDPGLKFLEEARRGSEEAFCQIVSLYQSKVRSYLGRFVRDRDAVHDLAQDTFVRAYVNLPAFKGDSTLSLWLLGIARNIAREYLRGTPQRRLGQQIPVEHALLSWSSQRVESEASEPGRHEARVEALRRCIEGLQGRSADLIRDYYFRGRAAAEIGRNLGKREGAVWITLMRVRNALRDCVNARLAGTELS